MATVVAVVSNFNNGAPVDTATVSMAATSGFGGIPVMPKIATLTNAFTSSLAYPWALGSAGGGTESTSGGQLSLNVPAATANANAGISTWDSIRGFYIYYDLTESSVVVQLVSVGATDPTLEVWAPQLIDTSGTWWGWHIINGQIQVDIQGSMLATATYSPTTHAWLRIREHAGITYFDYSPNGAAWTNFASMADIGAPQLIRPNLFTGSNAATNPASSAIFDNFNLPPVVNKIATLQDAFTTLDTTKWTPSSANISVVSGQLNITNPAGSTTYSQLYSGPSFNYSYYDLTESAVAIKLVSAGNQALASLECYPLYLTDETYDASPEKLFWYVNQGQIAAYQWVNGVQTRLAGATYSPVTHAWLRIRETAGTVYFETSPNGDSWASFTSTPDIPNITVLNVWIQNGTYASEASTTICLYDNLNLPPLISGRNYSLKFNRLYQGASVAMAAQTNLAVSGADVQFSTAPLAASAGMGIGGLVTEKVSPALSATASMTVTAAAMTTTGTVFAPTHLLTAADADFETGVGSWAAVQYCSIAQTTAAAHTGSGALAITSTVATSGATAWPQRYAVIPGQVYKASFWAMAATNSRNIQCQLVFYDTNLAVIPGSGGTALMGDQVGTWQQFGAPPIAVAPPNAVWADVLFVGQGAIPVNEVHYIDTVTLDQQPGGVAGLRVSATNITGLPNLLTPEQSGFEGGTNGGLTGISLTFANVTTPVHSGVHALQISTPQSSGTPAGYYTVPVTPGQQLAASGWAQAGSAALTTAYMSLAWIDASMSALSTSVGASVPITTSGWSYMTAAGTAPASAAYVRVTLNWPVTSGGLIIYWDDLSLSQQLNLSATAGMTVGATNIETASVAMSATTTTLRVIPVGLKFNTLTDDFSGSISSGKWALYSGPVATGGQLVLNMPANNPQQWGIASGSPYRDLTESYVVIQTVSISIIQASFHLTFKVVDAGTNGSVAMLYWEIFSTGGVAKIRAYSNINGYVGAAGATGVNYDPVAYAWLRIREHAGAVYFDYSPDGNIWTNWTAAPDPPSMTYMSVSYLAYTNGAEASATTVTADNFNLPPAVAPTLSATAGMTIGTPVITHPKIATLVDDFSSGSLAPKWQVSSAISSGTGTAVVSGGQLTLGNASSSLIAVQSTGLFDLTNSQIIAQAVNLDPTGWEVGTIGVLNAAQTTTAGAWVFQGLVGGGNAANGFFAYDPAVHKWFRMRESGGISYYDFSTDAITWTNIYSEANQFDMTAVYACTFNSYTASPLVLDNVNNPVTTDIGAVTLSATAAMTPPPGSVKEIASVPLAATAGMTLAVSVKQLANVVLAGGAGMVVTPAPVLVRATAILGQPLNVLAGDDSSFEGGGIGSWVGQNTTLANTTAAAQSGTHSLAITATTTTGGSASTASNLYPAIAGFTYSATLGSLAVTTGRSIMCQIVFYNAVGGVVGTANGNPFSDQTGTTWQILGASGVAPAGTAWMAVAWVNNAGVSAVGEVHYVDFVQLKQAAGATAALSITPTISRMATVPLAATSGMTIGATNIDVASVALEADAAMAVRLKMSDLRDNFNSGVLDPTIYGYDGNAPIMVNGQLTTTTSTAGGNWFDLYSNGTYDLTESSVFAEIITDSNLSLISEIYITALSVAGGIEWQIEAGPVLRVTTGNNNLRWSTPYNPVAHKWLRIRETGGSLYWDYSSDGMSWTNAIGIPISDPDIAQSGTALMDEWFYIDTEQDSLEASTTIAWDNLNVLPIPIDVGVVGLSATSGMTIGASLQQLANVTLAGGAALNIGPAVVTKLASAALAATAGMTVAASVKQVVTVPLVAAAALTIGTTSVTQVASVPMVAVSGLAIAPLVTEIASVALSASASMTVVGAITQIGAIALSATAGMTIATGLVIEQAVVAMSATTGFSASTSVQGVALLVGTTTLTIGATVTEIASVSLAGSTTLVVAGVRIVPASVVLSGTSGLTVAASIQTAGVVAFSVAASMFISTTGLATAAVAMSAVTTLVTAAAVTQVASVGLVGASSLTVAALVTELASVALSANAALIVAGVPVRLGTVSLSATAGFSLAPLVTEIASIALSATASLTVVGSRMVFGIIPMTGTTTLIIGTTVTQVALVAMAGNTTLAISARTTEVATVAFVPTSTLIVGAAVKELAAVALSAQSILVATAIVIQVAMVVMSADTDLDILGVTTEVAGVAFLSATALLAPGTVTEIDSGIFKATSKMTVVATVIVIKYAFRDLVRAGAQLYPYPAVGATPETSG